MEDNFVDEYIKFQDDVRTKQIIWEKPYISLPDIDKFVDSQIQISVVPFHTTELVQKVRNEYEKENESSSVVIKQKLP